VSTPTPSSDQSGHEWRAPDPAGIGPSDGPAGGGLTDGGPTGNDPAAGGYAGAPEPAAGEYPGALDPAGPDATGGYPPPWAVGWSPSAGGIDDQAPVGIDDQDGDRPSLYSEILLAVGVAMVIALIGFPLGWLWSVAAPWTPVQITTDGAVLSQPEQEQMIADEGWYLALTVLAGILVAALVWAFLRRYRGVPMAIGLALGSVGAGVITWRFGRNIGYGHFKDLVLHAPVGTNFGKPVDLRIAQAGLWHGFLPYVRGDAVAMAIAATVIYLLLAGFSAHSSLRPPGNSARSAAQPPLPDRQP
jgi:hypothetical protein